MSTVKISELALISQLNANTSNTLFVAVDIPTGVTGKFTGHTLAQGLYSNEVLNVGLNPVLYPNVAAQFSGNSAGYLQINLQNFTGSGSTDYVASTSDSTNANSFIDMGIDGKGYDDQETYSAFKPYDGYLYVHGPTDIGYSGNLILGTASHHANIVFMVGGTMSDNVRGYITRDGYDLLANVSVKGDLTTSVGLKFGDGSMQNTAANPIAFSQASYTQANTATTIAQAAYSRANSEIIGTAAYGQANVATIIGQASYIQANGAFSRANSEIIGTAAYVQANTATIIGQAAYVKANNASNTAISAYVQANTATGTGEAAYGQANTATTLAQGAFTLGYNALANTTGTFDGSLTITGSTFTQAVNTGNLQVVGTTNLTGTMNVSGAVSMNARVLLSNIAFPSTTAALTITGTANIATPANDGYMIQVSGKDGVPSRIVNDSYGTGAYALFAGRSARGIVTSPTALQSGDVISRFSSNGYGTTKYQTLGVGRIDFVAAQNFTDANTGSQIQFWNCPIGSNTLTNIATFNGDSATFTGYIEPQKGFVYTPRVPAGNQTTIAIDYSNDSMIKANLVADLTITHSNFLAGKVVELWLVNTGGTNRTVTHGLTALNSTTNSTTFTIPSTSCAYLKYFNIGVDLANTFVSVVHA